MTPSAASRGFTLFELIVVICVVAILGLFALDRFRTLQEAAEAAAVEYNLGALKAALLIRSTELATANRWDELRQLPGQNPFSLLEEAPASYGGALAGEGEPGRWYYSPGDRAVVYVVRRDGSFEAEGGGKAMRFGVVGINAVGQAVSGPQTAYVTLRPRSAYRWGGRLIR